MPTASPELLNAIFQTEAVSIWNRTKGPVFWYAAGVPGPFYVNTERVIGPETAARLLDAINALLIASNDPKVRVAKLNQVIFEEYEKSVAYRRVITEMANAAKSQNLLSASIKISGGERRDWLFSVPLAKELGLNHIAIFKNQNCFCPQGYQKNEPVLHVSDLINNAASYFDLWLPALAKAGLDYKGTLSVTSRGENGLKRLKEHGQKVVTLNHIDGSFFESWLEQKLITQDVLDELKTFFVSNRDWASRYLLGNIDLFSVDQLDKKSFSRLQFFFNEDPWKLKTDHEVFFNSMRQAIEERLARAA